MLSDYFGGDAFADALASLFYGLFCFCMGVGWACYKAVSWVEKMREWARVVTITESELDSLNGAAGSVLLDVAEIPGDVVLVVTPDEDCSQGTEIQLAGVVLAAPVLFDTASQLKESA